MSTLIKTGDALICCRGNTSQMIKDTRGLFLQIGAEFLDEAMKPAEAGMATPIGAIIQFVVKSVAAVARPAELSANELGLGIGATGLIAQMMEWTPPEMQLEKTYENTLGALSLDQASTLFEIASQAAMARHSQRVRNCLKERSLTQASKAGYGPTSGRSRKARPLNLVWSLVKKWSRRLGIGGE